MFPSLRGVEELTEENGFGRGSDEPSTVSKLTDLPTETVSEFSKSNDFQNDSKQKDANDKNEFSGGTAVHKGDIAVENCEEHGKDTIRTDEVIGESEKRDESQHRLSISESNSRLNDGIELKDDTAPDVGDDGDRQMENCNLPTVAPDSKSDELQQNNLKGCTETSPVSNENDPNGTSAVEYVGTKASEMSKSNDLHDGSKESNESAINELSGDTVVNQTSVAVEECKEQAKDVVVGESDRSDKCQTHAAQQHEVTISENKSSPNDDIEMKDSTALDVADDASKNMKECNVPAAVSESEKNDLEQNEDKGGIKKSSLSNEIEPNAGGTASFVVTDDIKNMWTVEEDLRLLDAISHLGLGNWVDISEEVAGASSTTNKTPKRCMERYLYDYLGKYGHILPQYTLVEVHNDEKVDSSGETKKAESNNEMEQISRIIQESTSSHGKSPDESKLFQGNANKLYTIVPTASLPDYDKIWKNPYIPPIENVKIGDDVGRDLSVKAEQTYMKLISGASNQLQAEAIKTEWEKKVNMHGGPTVLPPRAEEVSAMQGSGLAGYMPRRGDFDIEWDNDAEKYLQDMEFTQNDTPEDKELKIKVMKIYNARLDERERRKQFLIDRGLLDYRKKFQEDNKLPSDERDLKNRMRLFARFQTPEEHDALIQELLVAKRLRKEIARLQMYRRMGFTSIVEAEKFELDRNRREVHRVACEQLEKEELEMAAKELGADDSKVTLDVNGSYTKNYKQTSTNRQKRHSHEPNEASHVNENDKNDPESTGTDEKQNSVSLDTSATTNVASTIEAEFDLRSYPGHELLSKKELELCQRLKLPPKLFNEAKETLIKESLQQGLLEDARSTRRSIFKVDVRKTAEAIDFTLRPCWLPDMPHERHIQK